MLYKNYEYLKKNAPNFYNLVRTFDISDKGKVFDIDDDGRFQFIDNPNMKLSSYFEKYQNDLIIEHIRNVNASEVLVVGVGNAALLKRLSQIQEKKIHIVEFFEVFGLLMNKFSFSGVQFNRFSTITFMQENFDFSSVLANLMRSSNFDIDFFFLPQYKRLYDSEIREFYAAFVNAINSKKAQVRTNLAFEKRWIINAIKNFESVAKTRNILDIPNVNFNRSTAFIVSAGPSLNYELENLKSEVVKDNAYVFAMGSANKALLNAGIRPDAIFSYDPSTKNANVLDLYHETARDVPLVFSSTIGNESIKSTELENAYHFILSQDTLYKHFTGISDKTIIINDSPSVAVIALQIILKLGFDKIVFVGQNLALLDGKNYADNIVHKHLKGNTIKGNLTVEDVHGDLVETTDSLLRMKENIELYIKHNPGAVYINTTKNGAKIEGAPYKPMDEVLEILKQSVKKIELSDYEGRSSVEKDKVLKNIEKLLKIRDKFLEDVAKKEKSLKTLEGDLKEGKIPQDNKYVTRLYEDFRSLDKNVYLKDFLAVMLRTYLSIFRAEVFAINREQESKEKYTTLLNKYNTIYTYYKAYDKDMHKELLKLKLKLEEEA